MFLASTSLAETEAGRTPRDGEKRLPNATQPIEDWLDGDGLTGAWRGWRERLSDRGFLPYAVWSGEFFRNFDGGLRKRTDWAGLLEFGLDFDFGKMTGRHAPALHVSALWIQDDDDPGPSFVGSFDEPSSIGAEEGVRIFELYLGHSMDSDRWHFKFGHIALDEDFMISKNAALFLNSSFGPLPVQSANNPAPIWPLGALGGFAGWKPGNGLAFRFGVFNGDTSTQRANEHGFDYDFGRDEGALILSEVALDTRLSGRGTLVKLGGYYHSGKFEDFDSGKQDTGAFALYLQLDQVLVGTGDANELAAFVRAGWSPLSDRSVVAWVVDGGLTARGFRTGDRFGVGFSRAHFGHAFVDTRAQAGAPVVDDETIIELTYHAQVTPWFTLQPDLQFVIDPFDAAASDAIIGGLRANLTF